MTTLEILPRTAWGAAAPRGRYATLANPLGLTVHWNGPTIGPVPHARCIALIRGIQRYHQDAKAWLDLAYNFIVCRHGVVFEGRGWDARSAANGTAIGNASDHAVLVLVGVDDQVPDVARVSLRALANEHARRYDRTALRPHSAWKPTDCCGPTLRAWLTAGAPLPRPTIIEDDDMTDDQAKKLDEIHAALDAGKPVNAIDRMRRSLRPIGRKLGLVADVNGGADDVIA